MKTLRIDLEHQSNESHFQLQSDFVDLVTRFTAKALDIEALYNNYLPLYENEKTALDVIAKSAITVNVADADKERDVVNRGFIDAVRAASKHFNPEKSEAARRLCVVLDYYGNVNAKTYDAQTAAVNDLLDELAQPSNAADVAALGLTDWATEIRAKNDAFVEIMKARYSETSGKTDLRMLPVRAEIDKAFRGILDMLDALKRNTKLSCANSMPVSTATT